MSGPRGLRRSMQQQRSKSQDAAARRQAGNRGIAPLPILHRVRRQSTGVMTPRNHPQRTVVCGAIIEVDANRQHSPEHFGGRLHMDDARLDRPRTVVRHVKPFLHGDRQILMPGDFPVCRIAFVEQNCARNETVGPEHGFGDLTDGRMTSQATDRRRNRRQIAKTAAPRGSRTRFCEDRFDRSIFHRRRRRGPAVTLNARGKRVGHCRHNDHRCRFGVISNRAGDRTRTGDVRL